MDQPSVPAGPPPPAQPGGREEQGKPPREDAAKVQSGLKWTSLSMVFFRFARLGTTAILARILTELDFGLVTMAMAFILAFQALRDIGFGPAFVQRKGLDEDEERLFASTMFWVVVALNAVMFLFGWFMAPHAASYFPELPGLSPILRGVFALLLIEALSTTPTAILQKRLEFGLIATGEMVGIVLHAVLSIAFAWMGFGAWSIIIGTLGSRLAQTLLIVKLAGWRPLFLFDWAAARQLFGFGRYLWGNSLLQASNKVVDKMVVGRLLNGSTLGVYGNAYNLCTTTSKPIFSIILRVTFPALAKIQDDPAAMRKAVVAAVSNVALVTVPISVGLAVTAEDFVTVVYGAKWVTMAPIVQVLAFYGIVMSLASITSPVLMALGRVKQLFHFALFGQLLMVALFAALGQFGAMGIAVGLVAASTVAETLAFLYAARCLGLPARQAASPILRVGIAGLFMGAAVAGAQAGIGDVPSWLRLLVSVAVGVVSYGAAQLATNRSRFMESVAGFRSVLAAR